MILRTWLLTLSSSYGLRILARLAHSVVQRQWHSVTTGCPLQSAMPHRAAMYKGQRRSTFRTNLFNGCAY